MLNWFKENKKGIIRGMFLVPILLVMIISISHVVSWYDIANPFSWAIYLSVAIEIAAMSSIAAASVKIKGGVWLVFFIVTLVQFIGNIFFCYNEINVNSKDFKSWVELTGPIFEGLGSDITDNVSQRRWLALLEGGLLPVISLASLHFFIKGGVNNEVVASEVVKEEKVEEPKIEKVFEEVITEPILEEVITEPILEVVEPSKEVIEITNEGKNQIETGSPEIRMNPLAINMMNKTGLR